MSQLQHLLTFFFFSCILIFLFFSSTSTESDTKTDMEKNVETLLSDFQHFDLPNVDIYVSKSSSTGPITILVPGYKSSLAIWSRKIASENFEMGSMSGYVHGLLHKNQRVVVLQPKLEDVSYFSNSIDFIRLNYPNSIINIIAHSRGASYFFQWLENFSDSSIDFVDKCLLIDSIHESEPFELRSWLNDHVVNWTTSRKPIGQILSPDDISHALYDFESFDSFITWKSAGNHIHELTPFYSLSDIMSYF